ncbi:hypothetical protein WKV53_10615 [Luteolibacter sp. Y139]|uniref:Uncharacterized protein n=2 Tax=Luteolibacter soli TaxID=3135280 RepID=A0ABU9AT82_9BACT
MGLPLTLTAGTVVPPEGYQAPVVSKVQIVFSMVAHHHFLESRINQFGGPSGHTRYAVPHLVYEPLVTVSNPGGGAMDLTGEDAPRVRIWDPPVGFRFKRGSSYLRPGFSAGEFHGLARFQIASQYSTSARKSFIVQLGGLNTSSTPERRLTLAAGSSRTFAPWVESQWNWAVETAGGFVPYAFYDWNDAKVFTWKDPRAAVPGFGDMGFFCAPGWNTRAGFQVDHLSQTNTGTGTGWVSPLLTENVSVESRALRVVTDAAASDFQIDLLRSNSVDGALSTIQELKINLNDLVQPATTLATDPTAAATFKVGDILQTPNDFTAGGKHPFAVLTLIAKPSALADGSLQQLGTIQNAQNFYDLRFDPIDSFADVAAIHNLTPVPSSPTILSSYRSGDRFTLSFAAPAGTSTWKAVGGVNPAVLADDLTSRTTFTPDPIEPHLYQVEIDTTGLGPRYFVRLEEVPVP